MLTRSLAVALLLTASAAGAQTPPSAAAPTLGGPVIPGVCLLSREAIFANAAVGKAANARLQELSRAGQAEIEAQRKPMEAEAKALDGQPDNAQTKAKREAVATRWQALQLSAQHAGREIEATRAKALDRIATEAQPVIAQVYASRKCGLLLDRSSVLGGNFANDLTADAVRALDAKIQTISFERERLPQSPAPAGVPGPR